jgi:hypothetical protein
MIYAGFLSLGLFAAFFLQDALPALWPVLAALAGAEPGDFAWLARARLPLLPAFFFAATVTVPLPGMLAMAFAAGFLWDCTNALVWGPEFYLTAGREGPGFGTGPLVFGALGALVHGLRPLFQEGVRWPVVLAAGVATLLALTLEFLWINFRAGDFSFPPGFGMKVIVSALLGALAAAAILPLLLRAMRACGHTEAEEDPWQRP